MDSEIHEATAVSRSPGQDSGGCNNTVPPTDCHESRLEANGNINGDDQDELIDFFKDPNFETGYNENGSNFLPEPTQMKHQECVQPEIELGTSTLPISSDPLQDRGVNNLVDVDLHEKEDQPGLFPEHTPNQTQDHEELIQIDGSGDSSTQHVENVQEPNEKGQMELCVEIPQEANGSENSGPQVTNPVAAKPEASCQNGQGGIEHDVECLINNMSAAGLTPTPSKQSKQRASPSPRIPNGKSKTETGNQAKSAAVAQKKQGVVNESKTTPEPVRQSQEVRTKAAAASRRSETVGGSPASTSTARSQTSSQRVPVTGLVKASDSNAKKAQPAKPKTEQSQTSQRPSTSGSRAANLFETSPLVAGIPPELTKLAKTTPRHLIRPTSSVYRPTTSLPPQVKSLGKVSSASSSISTNTQSKAAKSSPTLAENSPASKTSSPKPKTTTTQPIKMGDADGSGDKGSALKDQFAAFSRFGDSNSDGKQITLSNCDKWMKQAHVIDGKKITTTDTSILFKKLFKTAKKIGFEDFKKYAEELATSKKLEPKDILEKLANSGAPGTTSATKAAHTGVIERLTDTSKYTGSHKERFDSAGKGRGIEGRRNVQDDSGYVAAFKEKKEEEKRKSEAPAK